MAEQMRAESAGTSYRPVGNVRTPESDPPPAHTWLFAADDGTRVELAVLAPDLVRVRLVPPDREPAHSWFVARADWPPPTIAVRERPDGLTLDTGALMVRIATHPFRVAFQWPDGAPFAEDDPALGMGREGEAVRCYKRLPAGERVLGAGERTDALDKRGRVLTFFNVDPQSPHGDDTDNMYVSIPFWLGMRAGCAYGILLDSAWHATLDAGVAHPERLVFGAEGGDLTYYVFGGPSPADVLARYADLMGHMPLPPRWALGYQQSRWSYFPQEHLLSVAREMRARRIPCDALYLDIDYMDGFRAFTWNPRRYPDPAALLADLRQQGFKVVTILDPGIKTDPTDPTFAEALERDYLCRLPDGSLFTGNVWPGQCAFPDFSRAEVRAWWGERHRPLLDAGVTGIWDDMNEPSLIAEATPGRFVAHATMDAAAIHHAGGDDDPPLSHAAFHNAYGSQMARATREGLERLRPDQRPFILTRSGGPGIQRYAAVWTGDNTSIWPHLQLGLRMCLSLGLSGVPFVGLDVGGFYGDATGELLTRFTQLGSMLPFFRNHSAMRSVPQEPWAFGQPFEAFCRQAIELRYRLLPYLYTAFERAAATGAPIARPLAYAFPDDAAAAAVEDEYLLGSALLVAPVLQERAASRSVYFPHGVWVDLWTGERHVGPTRARVDAPLDVLPLFVREGSIVPFGPVMQHTDERPADAISLACYLDDATGHAHGTLYEDDGRTTAYQTGASRTTQFVASRAPEQVTVRAEAPEGDYDPGERAWVVEVHLPVPAPRAFPRPTAVRLAERDLPPSSPPSPDLALTLDEAPGWSVVQRRYEAIVRVALGRVAAPLIVTVDLG